MASNTRRSARNQPLPAEEGEILRNLRGYALYARTKELFDAGWTLAAIGAVFDPKKARTTVKNWVDIAGEAEITSNLPPVARPTLATPEIYVPKRPASPGITPDDLNTIQTLAPIARKYRSSMAHNHKAAIANRELTEICERLAASGVYVRELADAAGVTYRAMARRLGRP